MTKNKRDWRAEADTTDEHEYGMCRNRQGGLGCAECSPGYDHYPEGGNAYAENLSGVDRVVFIPATY